MVLLRGVNWSGLEYRCLDGNNCNGAFTKQLLADIKNQWNINILRLCFNKQDFIDDQNVIFDYNGSYRQAMRDVQSWCQSLGITIIFDLQWVSTTNQQPNLPDSGTPAMWGLLAQETVYKNNPLVWFDIWNEPHDCIFSDWKSLVSQCIDIIRNQGANNICLVGGLDWAFDLSLWHNNYLTQSNVIYSSHVYGPSMKGTGAYDLDTKIGTVLKDGQPVFLGEIGAEWATTDKDWFINYALPWFDGVGRGSGIPTAPLSWTTWGMTNDPNLTTGDGITPSDYGLVVQNKLKQNILCPDPQVIISISKTNL
jgi:hypothetical protein